MSATAPDILSDGSGRRRWPASVLLLALILGLDFAWIVLKGSTAPTEFALIDVPIHLATCLLILMAVAGVAGRWPRLEFLGAALVASVALDIDHLPHYFGWDGLSGAEPRPYSHSSLTVALLASLALIAPRARSIALGAAFGVAAHLLRDLATGPGVALLWPLSPAAVQLPYALFALGVALAAALAWASSRPADEPARGRAEAISPAPVGAGARAGPVERRCYPPSSRGRGPRKGM